jgi:hypothetical protein
MNRVQTKPPPAWWPKPAPPQTVEQILDGMFTLMRCEVGALTCTHRNPVRMTRALCVLQAVYRIMITIGFPEYQSLLDNLQVGLDGFAREVRTMLARALDDPRTSAEDREAIVEYFAEGRR